MSGTRRPPSDPVAVSWRVPPARCGCATMSLVRQTFACGASARIRAPKTTAFVENHNVLSLPPVPFGFGRHPIGVWGDLFHADDAKLPRVLVLGRGIRSFGPAPTA